MRSFTIALDDENQGDTQQIEFEGDDPSRAFFILERVEPGKSATLSEEGKRLGTLRRTENGYWQICP